MGRIIELTWDCRDCDRKGILGRVNSCPGCGGPREVAEVGAIVVPENTSAIPSVIDPKLLELALAGRDWFCTYCAAGVRGDAPACPRCGAERPQAAAPAVLAPRRVPEPDHPPQKPTRVVADDPVDWPPPSSEVSPWVFVAGTVGLLLAGLLMAWLFESHRVVGEITSSTWNHEVTVERWTPTTTSEWERDVVERAEQRPVNGVGGAPGLTLIRGSCRSEKHHTEDVPCGTTQECEDTYENRVTTEPCGETCTSNGNGFATCVPKTCTSTARVSTGVKCEDVTRYCEEPVYAEKCEYSTQEWRKVDARRTRGTHLDEPRWDQPALGPLDRVRYTSEYVVNVQYVDGIPETYQHELGVNRAETLAGVAAVADEYREWAPGTSCYLEVNNMGLVASISLEPPKQ